MEYAYGHGPWHLFSGGHIPAAPVISSLLCPALSEGMFSFAEVVGLVTNDFGA
jgi:hypothetical protein